LLKISKEVLTDYPDALRDSVVFFRQALRLCCAALTGRRVPTAMRLADRVFSVKIQSFNNNSPRPGGPQINRAWRGFF
jgi:hypothetical protein